MFTPVLLSEQSRRKLDPKAIYTTFLHRHVSKKFDTMVALFLDYIEREDILPDVVELFSVPDTVVTRDQEAESVKRLYESMPKNRMILMAPADSCEEDIGKALQALGMILLQFEDCVDYDKLLTRPGGFFSRFRLARNRFAAVRRIVSEIMKFDTFYKWACWLEGQFKGFIESPGTQAGAGADNDRERKSKDIAAGVRHFLIDEVLVPCELHKAIPLILSAYGFKVFVNAEELCFKEIRDVVRQMRKRFLSPDEENTERESERDASE